MSEKVGSGDNDSQLLEQEQILLDWQDLPSYDLVKKPIEGEAENSQDAQDEKVGKDERLTAQVRGERLLRAVAESTPEEKAMGRVETEKDEATAADDEKSGVDTVMMRADQALGRERFVDLTDYLLELSYIEEPDEVMQEFRDEAEKVATIGAGDLWEAILHAAKLKRFAERLGDVKFYYSTNFADFAKILESGKLVRTDDEGSALKSDLKFSYDHMEDGEWKSGFADERGAKADDVTMMFDMSLLLEDSFVALGKNPSASEVTLGKSFLGVVVDNENYALTRRVLYDAKKTELPVYPKMTPTGNGVEEEMWSKTAHSAATLRMIRDKYVEDMRKTQELSDLLYGDAADEIIKTHLDEVIGKVQEGDLKWFYEQYHTIESEAERKRMFEDLVRYYKVLFEIGKEVEVTYDEKKIYTASCNRSKNGLRVSVDRNWAENTTVGEAAWVIGHEMCHGHQFEVSDFYQEEKHSADEPVTYEMLCYYNDRCYIDATMDVAGYKTQFHEREAYRFGELMEDKFAQVEKKMKQPAERARRAAKKMGSKIVQLGQKRKKKYE